MHPEHLDLIKWDIKDMMYYIEYPDDVPPGCWKNGAGELTYICDLGIEHLQNCIKRVERDIKHLKQSNRPEPVIDALLPRAKEVLRQLKEEYERKKARL